MEIAKITLRNRNGLHLRPAAMLVQFTRTFKSHIKFLCNRRNAESDSIMQVVSLGAARGAEITIIAEGEDEKKAVRDLKDFFADGAGI